LPTRLVDVGTTAHIQPRLRISADIDGIPPYLTLSHCWGENIPKRLLQRDLTNMMTSIRFKELSKSFQDALIITKELGFQYIWIDALCIIQDSDSDEDWRRESAQMCQVYSNSACNLAATASKDGSGGLFRPRDTRPLHPLRVRVGKSTHNVVDNQLWEREVERGPLNQRAWVCQERLLAPRILHFASTQVFWECNESLACESFPFGVPPCVESRSLTSIDQALTVTYKSVLDESAHDLDMVSSKILDIVAHDLWNSIVERYTKAGLKRETDKLIAIGGVAEAMHRALGDSYLAGLWRRYFEYQLLWYCDDSQSSKPKQYLAPSWSWASVNGKI
ncbi:HET-domain-containing protein, partial [Eremomyces bilateralis CBS 781.70]